MASAQTPAPAHAAGKRLSLSEILELLLTKSSSEHSSITLTRNAKGQTQIEVTVRTGDTDEIRTAVDAAEKAQAIYEDLRAKYPILGDTGGAQA